MKITKAKQFHSSFRTGIITGMTKETINSILGFKGTKVQDEKVTVEWRFDVDGIPCAIWDYKGSATVGQYSAYMPAVVGQSLFGAAYRSERLQSSLKGLPFN